MPNIFLGLKRNLNKDFLNTFKENKIKLRKKIHKFPQSKVIIYDVCWTLNMSILLAKNRTLVCHMVKVYHLSLYSIPLVCVRAHVFKIILNIDIIYQLLKILK